MRESPRRKPRDKVIHRLSRLSDSPNRRGEDSTRPAAAWFQRIHSAVHVAIYG